MRCLGRNYQPLAEMNSGFFGPLLPPRWCHGWLVFCPVFYQSGRPVAGLMRSWSWLMSPDASWLLGFVPVLCQIAVAKLGQFVSVKSRMCEGT